MINYVRIKRTKRVCDWITPSIIYRCIGIIVSNSRIVREFSEAGTGQRSSVPGMTQYDEVDIDAGNKRVSQESDEAFEISGSQESSSSPK